MVASFANLRRDSEIIRTSKIGVYSTSSIAHGRFDIANWAGLVIFCSSRLQKWILATRASQMSSALAIFLPRSLINTSASLPLKPKSKAISKPCRRHCRKVFMHTAPGYMTAVTVIWGGGIRLQSVTYVHVHLCTHML